MLRVLLHVLLIPVVETDDESDTLDEDVFVQDASQREQADEVVPRPHPVFKRAKCAIAALGLLMIMSGQIIQIL